MSIVHPPLGSDQLAFQAGVGTRERDIVGNEAAFCCSDGGSGNQRVLLCRGWAWRDQSNVGGYSSVYDGSSDARHEVVIADRSSSDRGSGSGRYGRSAPVWYCLGNVSRVDVADW